MEEKARQHIEEIRNNKFLIAQKISNPLTQDLHNAVLNLSAELYTKDVHFLMELIQNAEDNEYSEGVEPSLGFVLTYKDICGIGAPATLLVFNNEVGFSKDNIESLCSIGRSTKKCQRQKGFIGEKGIGFKSVFLVSAQPHILSNGYQIRFNEAPNQDCGLGYIVPEWFTRKPHISDIQSIFGGILPATTIILPLKHGKLVAVKKHLSEIHPEILLFLQKIKRLAVRENTSNSVSDSISAISISSEVNLVSPQNEGADSRIVHLAVQEKPDMPEVTCRYFIYRKVFPVDTKHSVDARKNVNDLTISLAFPFGDRLSRGSSSVGIFAYLPTAMVTNFPFIIQADFILTSSREAILLDNKWNLEILDHVPSCFLCALMTCVESPQMAEVFPIPRILEFLPLNESPVKQLNVVRESIKIKIRSKCIVPCESFPSEELVLCKPTEVARNSFEFKKILSSIKDLILPVNGKLSESTFFLLHSLDDKKYDILWTFVGVPSVKDSLEKHLEFIQRKDIVFRVPTQVYAEILLFIRNCWRHISPKDGYKPNPPPSLRNLPLFQYCSCRYGNVEELLCTLGQLNRKNRKVYYVDQVQHHSWVRNCSLLMGSPDDQFFLSDFIVNAITQHEMKDTLKTWLGHPVGVSNTSISSYCNNLCYFVGEKKDPKLAVNFAHFVYHSTLKFPSHMKYVSSTIKSMPVVDRSGSVSLCKKALVPASKSKWVKLFGYLNGDEKSVNGGDDMEKEYDWFNKYLKLSEIYLEASNFAGEHTPKNELLRFFVHYHKVIDLPNILPPNERLRIASCKLRSDQALLLLEWIQCLKAREGKLLCQEFNSAKYKIPERFIESIKCGKWMKTYSGFSSPTCSYLFDGIRSSSLLDIGKEFRVVSAIDEEYYEGKIRLFRNVLKFIGVQFGTDNLYELVVDQVKAASSSAMSAQLGISLLGFIRYSKNNNKLDVELLNTLKEGKWLKTLEGYIGPPETVYIGSGTEEAFLQITDLVIVDNAYYGNQLYNFVNELKLLGVEANLGDIYGLIPGHFILPKDLSKLTKEAAMLILKCIRKLGSNATSLKEKVRIPPWINTTLGFKCPSESLLLDLSWSSIINIVPLPLIDVSYYGSQIRTYKAELEAIGVAVDLDQACDMLIPKLKMLVSSHDLTAEAALLLLDFIKNLKSQMLLYLLPHLVSYLSEENWLKTCHGYKSACDCILSDSKWKTVSVFIDLPFIDEGFYGTNIFLYKNELKMLGVVVDFSEGAHIIAKGLEFPDNQLSIPADSIKSLLHCARSLRHSTRFSDESLLEQLVNKLRGCKWLKTHMGYRLPEESLMFKSEWKSYLEENDGPFLDTSFYGTLSSLEIEELRAIGVKADTNEVCVSIFHTLPFHDETPPILRVYRFLDKHKWSLSSEGKYSSSLWVPDLLGVRGRWASKSDGVLHDRDNLFGSSLHILDKHYDQDLLSFISINFGVDAAPTVNKYINLWNSWVKDNHSLSFLELHSFSQYISGNWKDFAGRNLEKSITVLPATTILGTVELVVRDELFIPDDLELKEAFAEVSESPLFVWFPHNGSSSLTKLYHIYVSLGVRKLSKCVQFSVNCNFEKIMLNESLLGKPLVKIVLAFLANPVVNMMVEERHRISKSLLDIPIFGTDSSMVVNCSLNLPISKKTMNVQVSKLFLWDKNLKRILVHKPSLKYKEIHKDIGFGSQFSQAISEAVLPYVTDFADDLCKIILLGFAFGFKEEDVDLLLVSQNLELSLMDNAFLECLFLATSASPLASRKRKSLRLDLPQTSGKVIRR